MSRIRDIRLPGYRRLPAALISATFVRAGGPGGQNVNKVATKADLRLDLDQAAGILDGDELARIRRRLASRMDAHGRLRIECSEHRTQYRNLETGIARMEALLAAALRTPSPRVATKPSVTARKRRLEQKRRRGRTKAHRRKPNPAMDE